MFWVTGSEIKIHMGVSIFRENVRYYVVIRQNWKRFLDDCFIIWNSDIPVEIFHTELNSLNDHIRFTINRSNIEMPL
jgi:hypothetical protein